METSFVQTTHLSVSLHTRLRQLHRIYKSKAQGRFAQSSSTLHECVTGLDHCDDAREEWAAQLMPTKLDAPIMATTSTNSSSEVDHAHLERKNELHNPNVIPPLEDVAESSDMADITPFQKMLSATTGSLITGLTSMQINSFNYAGTIG